MKKNRFMRLASCLLILCLITTCAISTTFAKYVSGDSASDTARVAKWGITVSTSGTLFGEDYKNQIVASGDATITVASSETDVNVVAPGTQNDVGMKIAISGQPEVDYAISVESKDTSAIVCEEISLAAGTYGVMVQQVVNDATDTTNLYAKTASGYKLYSALTTDESNVFDGKYYKLQDKAELDDVYNPIAWTVVESGVPAITAPRIADIATAINTNLEAKSADSNTAIDVSYTLHQHTIRHHKQICIMQRFKQANVIQFLVT